MKSRSKASNADIFPKISGRGNTIESQVKELCGSQPLSVALRQFFGRKIYISIDLINRIEALEAKAQLHLTDRVGEHQKEKQYDSRDSNSSTGTDHGADNGTGTSG